MRTLLPIFTGESLRNVQKFLRLQGVEVCHQTVYNWIAKYTALMKKYLDKITPQVSGVWRADEMWVKIHGDMKYVFAMMDDETRFWIAQEVADSKFTHDARNLFRAAREVAGRKPNILITDGLKSYHDAYNYEYWTHKLDTQTVHIRHITLTGEHHNIVHRIETLDAHMMIVFGSGYAQDIVDKTLRIVEDEEREYVIERRREDAQITAFIFTPELRGNISHWADSLDIAEDSVKT